MASVRRIEFSEYGGREVLEVVERPVPEPGPGEARVRHGAVGVNFIDTYHRSGLYPVPSFPSGIGLEAAGEVSAIGPGVEDVAVGDRVAYCMSSVGAYATEHVVRADRLIPVPESVSDADAAAVMLKGLTVQYLIRQIRRVSADDTVLFHAAAGGVGLIAMQWLRALGATVIGTVGTEEKAELARRHGCDHVILYDREDVVARVRELTGGAGVPIVYDSVGASTFDRSLDCLSPRGLLVSFGNASGPVRGLDLGVLALKGSLMVTRPTLATFSGTREALRASSAELFGLLADGSIQVIRGEGIPLEDARTAHERLESRQTTGSTILIP